MSAEGLADRAQPPRRSEPISQEFELASTWISTVDEMGITNSAMSVLRQRSPGDQRADTWLREAVDFRPASQHDQAMDLLDLLMERRADDPSQRFSEQPAQAGDGLAV